LRGTPYDQDVLSPEWINNILSWSETAVINVTSNLNKYISDYKITGSIKYWITGHSRGGGLANLLGVERSDKVGSNNVFAYCFAPPNVAMPLANTITNYRNIFCYNHESDWLIGNYPLWKSKYGIKETFSSEGDTRSIFSTLTEKTYGSGSGNHAHSSELYLAYLLTEKKLTVSKNSRTIIVRCPVDIEVYNASDKLVGRVTNNIVDTSINQEVLIGIDNDEKYIYLPPDGEFSIKMIGTDNGTLNFHVGYTDMDTWDMQEEKAFKNIKLYKNKTMQSTISDVSDVKLYVVDQNGKATAEILTDGTEKTNVPSPTNAPTAVPATNNNRTATATPKPTPSQVPTATLAPVINITADREGNLATVAMITDNKLLFESKFDITPPKTTSINPAPTRVRVDVSSLSTEEKANLTGVIYDKDGKVIKRLGGELSADGKTFTFYTPETETATYGVIKATDLLKVVFNIGKKNYTAVNTANTTGELDVAPYIDAETDRTMIPLRFIAELLGATVDWQPLNDTDVKVLVTYDGKTITIVTGQDLGNGLGVAVFDSESNRSFVPLRYILEQFDANVVWLEETKEICIYK